MANIIREPEWRLNSVFLTFRFEVEKRRSSTTTGIMATLGDPCVPCASGLVQHAFHLSGVVKSGTVRRKGSSTCPHNESNMGAEDMSNLKATITKHPQPISRFAPLAAKGSTREMLAPPRVETGPWQRSCALQNRNHQRHTIPGLCMYGGLTTLCKNGNIT